MSRNDVIKPAYGEREHEVGSERHVLGCAANEQDNLTMHGVHNTCQLHKWEMHWHAAFQGLIYSTLSMVKQNVERTHTMMSKMAVPWLKLDTVLSSTISLPYINCEDTGMARAMEAMKSMEQQALLASRLNCCCLYLLPPHRKQKPASAFQKASSRYKSSGHPAVPKTLCMAGLSSLATLEYGPCLWPQALLGYPRQL